MFLLSRLPEVVGRATKSQMTTRVLRQQRSHSFFKHPQNKKRRTTKTGRFDNGALSSSETQGSKGVSGVKPNPKLFQRQAWHANTTQRRKASFWHSLIQPTQYLYRTRTPPSKNGKVAKPGSHPPSISVLPSLNASAMLDPLKYCRTSAKTSHSHGVSRSINGTDAARRLLKGKKEFIDAGRSLRRQPFLLEGHGVPPQLFQHCVDMADALLLQYSPDVVECTFHNYNYPPGSNKLPSILRIRSREATNQITHWPPNPSLVDDWDYHLELYLTVMERISRHLGAVLQRKPTNANKAYLSKPDDGRDDDEITSSPLLFPFSSPPQWNVDISRSINYELARNNESAIVHPAIPPMPIVEFRDDSERTGHVVIRIQGTSAMNSHFGSDRSRAPVSLVFDAAYRKD